ncbi:hypothetical protein SCUP234_12778 [Seiridium cupressi]
MVSHMPKVPGLGRALRKRGSAQFSGLSTGRLSLSSKKEVINASNARNGGLHDPVLYRDWRYAKIARNRSEGHGEDDRDDQEGGENVRLLHGDIELRNMNRQATTTAYEAGMKEMDEDYDDMPAPHFRPRFLCFLRYNQQGMPTHCETWNVADWINQHGDYASTDFVFLSYTRRQFCATLSAYTKMTERDRAALLSYGMEAARAAGKQAFWVDFECIRDIDNVARAESQSNDVYRICDIVHAAHSLVVLVGPSPASRLASGTQQNDMGAMDDWLQVWGTRLWTLPEVLLCSSEHPIKLYVVGGPIPPEEVAKRNLASRAVWPDAKLVRQLVDHYESSIHLTPLELVSIALERFSWRHTFQLNKGDISYALMGLMRRRPAVAKSDTSFEAFAGLSLANDSDKLLERLICMEPTDRFAPWHEIKDAWSARLWNIEPRCQVAGIAEDETVTLDGAFGATIQWDAMEQVAFMKRPTFSRLIGKVLLRGVPGYLITGLTLTIGGAVLQNSLKSNSDDNQSSPTSSVFLGLLIPGIIFLVPSAIIVLLAPIMLLSIYRGKFWSTQARFIGIEGIPEDIGGVERMLFGFSHGRLKWSVAESTLSRHRLGEYGELNALPPVPRSEPAPSTLDSGYEMDWAAEKSEKETLFTLIDTYAMTATSFYAIHPPTTVIICGQEGGMQRAVLCSYKWQTGTFVRESVIRVRTMVLDRMLRVDRFRFSLRHKAETVSNLPPGIGAGLFAPDNSGVISINSVVFDVGYFVAQVSNRLALRSVNLGHVVAMATPIKGIWPLLSFSLLLERIPLCAY